MPLAEAQSLLQVDALFVEEHQPDADRITLEQLALSCEPFSPLVGIERCSQPSSIILDISGLEQLFGSEAGLMAQLKKHFHEQGFYVVASIGQTIGAAWAMAHYVEQHWLMEGTEEAQQDEHPTENPDGRDSIAYDNLPVAALRIPQSTRELLARLGLETVEQLLRLPRAAIKSRLGDVVCHRIDELTGEREEVLDIIYRAAELSRSQFLDYPITHRDTIDEILRRLMASLCKELADNQRGGLEWRVTLHSPEQLPTRIDINLFQPTATPEHVMQLCKMQFENAGKAFANSEKANVPAEFAVQEFEVSVIRSVLLVERQRELFDEDPKPNQQALAQLVNRLASRLGSKNVVQPKLLAGAQAEYAASLNPLVGPEADVGRNDTADTGHSKNTESTQAAIPKMRLAGQTDRVKKKFKRQNKKRGQAAAARPNDQQRLAARFDPLDRPLRLYQNPVPIQAVIGPQGRPGLLVGRTKKLKVIRSWGPERIETGWWRGPTIRRDYWRVEMEDGRWLWVYRNLRTREWFLHGEF